MPKKNNKGNKRIEATVKSPISSPAESTHNKGEEQQQQQNDTTTPSPTSHDNVSSPTDDLTTTTSPTPIELTIPPSSHAVNNKVANLSPPPEDVIAAEDQHDFHPNTRSNSHENTTNGFDITKDTNKSLVKSEKNEEHEDEDAGELNDVVTVRHNPNNTVTTTTTTTTQQNGIPALSTSTTHITTIPTNFPREEDVYSIGESKRGGGGGTGSIPHYGIGRDDLSENQSSGLSDHEKKIIEQNNKNNANNRNNNNPKTHPHTTNPTAPTTTNPTSSTANMNNNTNNDHSTNNNQQQQQANTNKDTNKTNPQFTLQTTSTYKILLLGTQSCGKTSLLRRFVNDSFTQQYLPTVGIDYLSSSFTTTTNAPADGQDEGNGGASNTPVQNIIKLHLFDTSGSNRFSSLIPNYLRDCSVALLCFDLTSLQSYEDVFNNWIRHIRGNYQDNIIIIVVGCKSDLSKQRVISYQDIKTRTKQLAIPYIETSSQSNYNVSLLFQQIATILPEIHNIKNQQQQQQQNGGGSQDEDITMNRDGSAGGLGKKTALTEEEEKDLGACGGGGPWWKCW